MTLKISPALRELFPGISQRSHLADALREFVIEIDQVREDSLGPGLLLNNELSALLSAAADAIHPATLSIKDQVQEFISQSHDMKAQRDVSGALCGIYDALLALANHLEGR